MFDDFYGYLGVEFEPVYDEVGFLVGYNVWKTNSICEFIPLDEFFM